MKRTIILAGLIACIVTACSVSKQARTYKQTLNGKWKLETATTQGVMGKVKIRLFEEADYSCFLGSDWEFNSRNSLGSYYVPSDAKECGTITRDIRWSIYEEAGQQYLQFKRLDTKLKPMDNGNGFRLAIIHLDKTSMQLQSTVQFENKPLTITYNFTKN